MKCSKCNQDSETLYHTLCPFCHYSQSPVVGDYYTSGKLVVKVVQDINGQVRVEEDRLQMVRTRVHVA